MWYKNWNIYVSHACFPSFLRICQLFIKSKKGNRKKLTIPILFSLNFTKKLKRFSCGILLCLALGLSLSVTDYV